MGFHSKVSPPEYVIASKTNFRNETMVKIEMLH